MYTLVVCEKPDAARRIAQALGDPKLSRPEGVPVYDVTRDGTRFVITSALGHLYGVADFTASKSVYPVLDLGWAPIPKNPRAAKAIKVISGLATNASHFVHACDYDQEGEVIGHSILEYACGGKYGQSRRAKFSTLTDDEIRDSFASLGSPNTGLAKAGRARHMLDFLYGVNLSRALSQSLKATRGGYHNLSIGRVQGPTLSFAVDREFEIRLHVPDPYWTIAAKLASGGKEFLAQYENPKIKMRLEAKEIHNACVGARAAVAGVESRKIVLRPPTPFNVGDLQHEAYRVLNVSPGYTLAIAEKLYLQALISYPRTSSQKLPSSIGYSKIISALSNAGYGRLASILLSKGNLVPNEGKMSDPAHPAIYPTGVSPRGRLGGLEFKIYDLIVKRFLATFGDPAATLRTDVSIDIAGRLFRAEGVATLHDGWMGLYKPYVNLAQHSLPEMKVGDELSNLGIEMQEKFTQPPRRYNQASLLERMEREQIGTKSTRADVITTLFKRNYVSASREGIGVTDVGLAVMESMKEFSPLIVSTDLTRDMEEQLEKVEIGIGDAASTIQSAVDRLVESLTLFIEKELDIGGRIGDAVYSDKSQASIIGRCPLCKTGSLRMITSRKTRKRFVGCSNYAEGGCRASAPLPQKGRIRISGKACKQCGWPVIGIVFARRSKQWRICINMECPSKKQKGLDFL